MGNFNDDRVRAVLLGRRAVRVMPFPGVEGAEFGIRILVDEEIDHARMAAVEYVKNFTKRLQMDYGQVLLIEPDFLDREIQRQIIWRSFIDPDTREEENPAPYFPDPEDVRKLDAVLVETLHQCYLEHQNYINPLTGLSDEEVDALVEALGKESIGTAILGQYDAPTLRKLVHTLVARLASSRISRSSSGGSPATAIQD